MSSLFKKLNLGTHEKILILNAPESFQRRLDELDDEIRVLTRVTGTTRVGFAIGFASTETELDRVSNKLVKTADGDAVVWLAYPKKSSKSYVCEFNRDSGWEVLGEAGFEGVRQVAIDEDWSALRFRRVENIKSFTRRKSMAISKIGSEKVTHRAYEVAGVLTNAFHVSYFGFDSLSTNSGFCFGFTGLRSNFMCASCGVRPPFFVLHLTQHATTLSQVVAPSRLRGITWSMLSWLAGKIRPQY